MFSKLNKWSERLSRRTSSGDYIAEIDGLRFLAIGSVLVFHLIFSMASAYGRQLQSWEQGIFSVTSRNPFGVQLFFVISGFILAMPFIRHFVGGEKPVSIVRYYLRRLTRLEPPYVIVLVSLFAVSWFLLDSRKADDDPVKLLVRLFYGYGLVYHHPPEIDGVTWTLEIEVQFYLLVPLLVQLFRFPALIRRGILAGVVLLLPWIPVKGILYFTVLNSLAYFLGGFLLADLYLATLKKETDGKVMYDWGAVAVFVLALSLRISNAMPLLIFLFLFLMFRGRLLRRWFSYRPVYVVGGMCYSIYLLHYPIMSMFSRWLAKTRPQLAFGPAVLLSMLVCLPVVLVFSTCFFALIERPCMDSRWPKKLLAWMKGDLAVDLRAEAKPPKTSP
ncbi:acyltransferase family protein [Pedosphaera parvula]|uniref:Acyltransferase 3 n=1 Tax=Pedosphaera parvula (strain Ellin514) TaxID=320771 RepID=B9XSQ0_PEDPL|nr:acyltransferase [Pedosphaera parvula]EEF57135.1 acyltransferase 3 [Pedosphaera parvula Ellin514]